MSCKGCAYAVLLSGTWCCDYLSVTGHRLPCPPGEGCTVVRKAANLTKKGSAFMKRREWDTEKAKALYGQKLSDAEIAGRVGATASAVAYWRRGLGLPANQELRPPPLEALGPKSALPPPASPLPRPPALPDDGASVDLSVELDGHSFALRAPDLEGAAWIHQYAGRLLADMGQIAAKLKEETDDA